MFVPHRTITLVSEPWNRNFSQPPHFRIGKMYGSLPVLHWCLYLILQVTEIIITTEPPKQNSTLEIKSYPSTKAGLNPHIVSVLFPPKTTFLLEHLTKAVYLIYNFNIKWTFMMLICITGGENPKIVMEFWKNSHCYRCCNLEWYSKSACSQAWWHMPVIPPLRRLRQEDSWRPAWAP